MSMVGPIKLLLPEPKFGWYNKKFLKSTNITYNLVNKVTTEILCQTYRKICSS